jgi:protocatechuate 3,4-dioxygenase alpha subunit
MIFPATPSQTVGPYYAIGLPWGDGAHVVPEGTPGAIRLHGTIYDGRGEPIPDHLIETWQCDPEGRFADLHPSDPAHPNGPSTLEGFRGFGRHGEEQGDGTYAIHTVKPGRVPIAVVGGGEVLQAPHVDVSLFARGLLDRVVTRIYFGDEAEANAQDPVLRSVPEDRRATLIAAPDGDGGYRFDIRLQGEGETVFFAV